MQKVKLCSRGEVCIYCHPLGRGSFVLAQHYEETARGQGNFTQRRCVGVGGKRELTGHGDRLRTVDHRLAEKVLQGAGWVSERKRMSPCGKNRFVEEWLALVFPRLWHHTARGWPLPEAAVCLSLQASQLSLARRTPEGDESTSRSHGLAWLSRRLGNSG